MSQQWSTLQRRAKAVESRLQVRNTYSFFSVNLTKSEQTRIDEYSALAQKLNADFLCDEENPLIENREDESLAKSIEIDLNEVCCILWIYGMIIFVQLASCISSMKEESVTSSSRMNEELIKRYHEIYCDFNNEFKTIAVRLSRQVLSFVIMLLF